MRPVFATVGPILAREAGFSVRCPPRLILVVELEELPRARVDAMLEEDELRLRHWLAQPTVRDRLTDCLEDALSELRDAA